MSCPDCFRGGVTTSHPAGTTTTIHGLPTYVAQPPAGVTPKGLIVIITDAFGWEFPNNRVLSDHYAQRGGFLVYCPDFMNGNSLDPKVIPLMDQVMNPAPSWLSAFGKPFAMVQALTFAIPWKMKSDIPKTSPVILKFFQDLRTSPPPFPTPNLKIGAAGFCWGGKHTFILSRDTESSRVIRHESQTASKGEAMPLLDCAFTAHPSYLEVPSDIEAVKIPLSVAVGDEDMAMKGPAIKQMKGILDAKEEKDKFEVVIMPGAKHGFAVRTHPEDEFEMECAEKAERQAVKWFGRWFA
ncbi:related to dienelactone hydrolase family protein [Phialocephala subalpina]|uniref:Related to dienelactone hydrolase family protein n=1 Tax=Phialocephala subalpina TaxID=576137 RepID=A0A1L7WPJ2_9HELO|nr:related to dienelactone hydrolase family protein [Phialocephala subalpina]